jgi:hypothetical protein
MGEGQGLQPIRTKWTPPDWTIEGGQPRGSSDERRKEERGPRRDAKPASKEGWTSTPVEPTDGEKEEVWRVETLDQTERKGEGETEVYPKAKPVPT